MTERTKGTLLAVLRAGIALLIFVLILVNYDRLQTMDVRALAAAQTTLVAAIAVILGIYLVKSVLFVVPAMLIYVSVGMVFPPLTACLVNAAGILLEITATYFLGRFLGGDAVRRLLQKSEGGRKLLQREIGNSIPALLTVRALPVFPIDFVSLLLGAARCKIPRYLALSLVGILPRVVLFTILGDGIYDYIPVPLLMKIAIFALPVGAGTYLLWFFIKKRRKTEPEPSDAAPPDAQ